MSQPPGIPWAGPSDRERSRVAAERYALAEGLAARRRARRATAEPALRRFRHRTALLLVATARRVDAA